MARLGQVLSICRPVHKRPFASFGSIDFWDELPYVATVQRKEAQPGHGSACCHLMQSASFFFTFHLIHPFPCVHTAHTTPSTHAAKRQCMRQRRPTVPGVVVFVLLLLGVIFAIPLAGARQGFALLSKSRCTHRFIASMASSATAPPSSTPVAVPAGGGGGGGGERKFKALALHGFMQSGKIFREKTGSFRKSIKKNLGEVVYVEGPYALEGNGRSWWRWTDERGADGAPVERPSKAQHYSGVDEALEVLKRELNAHRPDALLGFSQGATAAALLLAALTRDGQGSGQHVPRFAILVGGFVPRDENVAALLSASPPRVPTLFISGEDDQLVPPERSRALMACFGGHTELLLHPGGHHVPSLKGEMKAAVFAFIEKHA